VLAVKPWGGVYIDGRPRGISPPLKEVTLPEGRHRVEIRNTGFAAFASEIDVKAGASVTISHTFRAP
jgi:hypothetical protein